MEVKKVLKLPKSSLLLGVLFSLKEASFLDCVNLQSTINNILGFWIDYDYGENYDEELFICRLGKYSLKGGVDINQCLENVYQQFSDENLLTAYKKAIEEFKEKN